MPIPVQSIYRLSPYTFSMTVLDSSGNPVVLGSCSVVVTDNAGNGAIVLAATNMPYSGSGGIYSYTIASTVFVAGGIYNIVGTAKDPGGIVIGTRIIQALAIN